MKDQETFDTILTNALTNAFRRMHRYTWAEASLQGLQALWDPPIDGYSWATAGYMGAISSGHTTCGLLIGSSIAIGLLCCQGKQGIPEENESERNRAVKAVGELYSEFLSEFGSTDCKELSQVDFSKSDEVIGYIQNKGWKKTCDIYLQFVLNRYNTPNPLPEI